MNRRKFIITSTQAGTAVILGLTASCKKEDTCDDLSALTTEQIEERKSYNYLKESPHPAKKCINCELWIEPEENSPCGSCGLFEGPVQHNGYCDEWVMTEV